MRIVEKILERFLSFFTIFDVSYLISGIATFSIILWGLYYYQYLSCININFLLVIYFIILAYLCGLISFAFGKSIRNILMKSRLRSNGQSSFMRCFTTAINYANTHESTDSKKLIVYEKQEEAEMYYAEMWYFIREKEGNSMSFTLLNKYWVSQAIYDGLLFSALLAFVLGIIMYTDSLTTETKKGLEIGVIIFSILAVILSFLEGKRYAETQIREVVIVYKKSLNQ